LMYFIHSSNSDYFFLPNKRKHFVWSINCIDIDSGWLRSKILAYEIRIYQHLAEVHIL